ncbi:hypothetical protein [Pseudolactococcus insecticola]|uniref:Uncharacterized protein n=1 Tax=Pseudolactococcus insecticola TaxID=2709158 RepID=A0A6A0B9Y5_9LACT|nr:hypothetical protein [Lactococcus insecticola]GFH41433.1 hypothetical protein Hs20B_18310 [Lactococcus insecticola]
MTDIKTEYVDKTLEGDSQEITIFKLADEQHFSINCTIPKYARKYQERLTSGRVVINKNSGLVVEIHGILGDGIVNVSKPKAYTDEQRSKMSERAREIFAR